MHTILRFLTTRTKLRKERKLLSSFSFEKHRYTQTEEGRTHTQPPPRRHPHKEKKRHAHRKTTKINKEKNRLKKPQGVNRGCDGNDPKTRTSGLLADLGVENCSLSHGNSLLCAWNTSRWGRSGSKLACIHTHRNTQARSLSFSLSLASARALCLSVSVQRRASTTLEELGFRENGHPSEQASNSSTYNESHPWRDRSSFHGYVPSISQFPPLNHPSRFSFSSRKTASELHTLKVVRKATLISSSILWWIFASWPSLFFQSILWYRKFGETSPPKNSNF